MTTSKFNVFSSITLSIWSFVIFPLAPAVASIVDSEATQTGISEHVMSAEENKSGNIASFAQTAGSLLASGPDDLTQTAADQARGMATGAATAEVERWLTGFGTARVRIDVDRNFTLKNSAADLLFPWYESQDLVVFTQHSLHRTDDRTQVNLGAGVRHFGPQWMAGINAFYDHDLTRYHSRAGLGAELWRDYMKLSTNGYLRLSDWRSAPELSNDYEARPANGWDVRAEGWLPAYPQLGARLSYEQYYGREVALFGSDNRQSDPHAVTAGLNWTPFPLVTASAEHRTGKGGESDSRIGLQLTWTPGMSWSLHLDPGAVQARRTLAGSRLDLVERNNNIVLEYRKKELIKLMLRERLEGIPGQEVSIIGALQTKYPLQTIDWYADEFLAGGGEIYGSGTATKFILPAYRFGSSFADEQRLNTYTIRAVARDHQGNSSSEARGILVVKDTGVQITADNLTVSNGARANGTDINTLTAVVTDSAGRRVGGEAVSFLLPTGVSQASTSSRAKAVKVMTNGNGVALLEIVSLTPGSYTIQASAGTAPAVSVQTTFYQNTDGGPQDLLNLEITTPINDAMADGISRNRVRVMVKDRNGAIQTNSLVHFSVTTGATLSATEVTTDSNGMAEVTLTSTAAATYTVTASAGGGTQSTPVTFRAIQPQGTLTASPDSIMADNTETSMLTLRLTDQNGTAHPGQKVSFSVAGVTGTTISAVSDNGNGAYTAVLKGNVAGKASISTMVNGSELSGALVSVTLKLPLPPRYSLTAETHLDPHTHSNNSGFPTTGFKGATFTVTGLPGGTTPADYNWKVQTNGGGNVNWLSVDQTGVVIFNNKPSSHDKSVEIIAKPKSGGDPLGYRFTLKDWLVNGGAASYTRSEANALCVSLSASLPAVSVLTNHSGYTATKVRGTGAMYNEWGAQFYYKAGFSSGRWALDRSNMPGYSYVVNMDFGSTSPSNDEYKYYGMCHFKI